MCLPVLALPFDGYPLTLRASPGGVVEDRFMSVADLERYAQLPPLDALRAQFCHLLGSQAAALSASLGHHQAALVRTLAAYAEPTAEQAAETNEER